jgi:hypothetical protein
MDPKAARLTERPAWKALAAPFIGLNLEGNQTDTPICARVTDKMSEDPSG